MNLFGVKSKVDIETLNFKWFDFSDCTLQNLSKFYSLLSNYKVLDTFD